MLVGIRVRRRTAVMPAALGVPAALAVPAVLGFLAGFLTVAVPQVSAEPFPTGDEQRVDTTAAESQRFPAIADITTGFVVVWNDRNFDEASPDGDAFGVFGQRVDRAGMALGSEFQVNTFTTGNQRAPAVTADGSGRFLVVWEGVGEAGGGIFAQRYDSTGNPSGSEFQVAAGNAFGPRVAADVDGNMVVVWYGGDDGGAPFGVFAQRYDGTGAATGSEFLVNTYTSSSQRNPAIASDPDGNFVIAWESLGQDGDAYGVFAQRYASDGSPRGTEFRVNSATDSNQRAATVGVDSGGGFVIAWQSNSQESSYDVRAQRFDSSGATLGTTFLVNTYSSFDQRDPEISIDTEGSFTVVWASQIQDGDAFGVFGQQFDSTGTPNGTEFAVNATTTGDQDAPAVSAFGEGEFRIVWDARSAGVFERGFAPGTPPPTATATPLPSECTAGDCDGSGDVAINELVFCADLTVSQGNPEGCSACDDNGDGRVAVNELLDAVEAGLNGCP